jgi:hypothetical protein
MHHVLPDAACPGLYRKPLDATIGQLLAPYHPSGCQGNRQKNNNARIYLLAGCFNGHSNALVGYCEHHSMKGSRAL